MLLEKSAVYFGNSKLVEAEISSDTDLKKRPERIAGRFIGLDPDQLLQLYTSADRVVCDGKGYRIESLSRDGTFSAIAE